MALVVWKDPRGRLVQCLHCGLVYADGVADIDYEYWEEHGGTGEDVDDFYWDNVRRSVYGEFLDQFTQPGQRLLDVGAGKGYFVAACRREGLIAEGIDVSPGAVRWAIRRHGPWFRQGLVETESFEGRSYDVVTLWDAIEHVPNPTDVVAGCLRALRSGGQLFIQTPNVGFHLRYARIKQVTGFDKDRGTFMELPDHIHHFSPQTLTRLCQKVGFSNVRTLVLSPIDTVAGRRSKALASLKRGYVRFAKALFRLTGVNVSNTVHLIGERL